MEIFFSKKKNYSEYCNHAEWLNYDDLKIDVSAVIVSGGHYFAKSSALTKAHGWTRILGENIILSFVLLYSVGIISGASMSVKTLGDSGLGGLHSTRMTSYTLGQDSCAVVSLLWENFSQTTPTLNCRSGLGYRISPMKLDPDQDLE